MEMEMGKTDVSFVNRKQAISRSREFEKKLLATHAVNVGLLCGHGCTYCSTPALVRTHPIFQEIGRTSFSQNLAVVDPETPDRIAEGAKRLKPMHTVMLATITDAWSPEAQEHNLGGRCLDVLGAGNFSNAILLPALSKTTARLGYVADIDPAAARHAARKFGAAQAVTDHEAILADPEVETVFIVVGHHLHARFV